MLWQVVVPQSLSSLPKFDHPWSRPITHLGSQGLSKLHPHKWRWPLISSRDYSSLLRVQEVQQEGWRSTSQGAVQGQMVVRAPLEFLMLRIFSSKHLFNLFFYLSLENTCGIFITIIHIHLQWQIIMLHLPGCVDARASIPRMLAQLSLQIQHWRTIIAIDIIYLSSHFDISLRLF